MTSNKFIIKTHANGVKVLTINELKSNKYSLKRLLDNKDGSNKTDSLGLLASDSHIIIAATQNEWVNDKYKSKVQVIYKKIAEIWDEHGSLVETKEQSVAYSHCLFLNNKEKLASYLMINIP